MSQQASAPDPPGRAAPGESRRSNAPSGEQPGQAGGGLQVTPGPPQPTDEPDYVQVTTQVRDPGHVGVVAVFTHRVRRLSGGLLPYGGTCVRVAVGLDAPGAEPGPQSLHMSLLRDLPLVRWELAAQAHALYASKGRRLPQDVDTHYWAIQAEVERVYPGLSPLTATRQLSRRWQTAYRLAEVAAHYRINIAAGLPDPAARIARDWGEKPATVRTWVHRARQAGFLEPFSTDEGADSGRS